MPSYGSDAGLTAYLNATGRVLPVGYTEAVARSYGSLYVDSFEDMYRGWAVTTENSFPRDLWPTVPINVEHASYEAAFAYASGVAIFGGGGTAGGQVVEERVDVLSIKYAAPQDGWGYWESNRFILPLAYALLMPFFKRKDCWGASAFVV